MMIDALESHTRLVVDAQLQPVVGTTFQPTGFANLGAAEFRRPGGPASLLVESVQSMANHLEAQGFDAATREPIVLLRDLPWIGVRATDGDERLTSSRQEPHRLAAVYLREARRGRDAYTTASRQRHFNPKENCRVTAHSRLIRRPVPHGARSSRAAALHRGDDP